MSASGALRLGLVAGATLDAGRRFRHAYAVLDALARQLARPGLTRRELLGLVERALLGAGVLGAIDPTPAAICRKKKPVVCGSTCCKRNQVCCNGACCKKRQFCIDHASGGNYCDGAECLNDTHCALIGCQFCQHYRCWSSIGLGYYRRYGS